MKTKVVDIYTISQGSDARVERFESPAEVRSNLSSARDDKYKRNRHMCESQVGKQVLGINASAMLSKD